MSGTALYFSYGTVVSRKVLAEGKHGDERAIKGCRPDGFREEVVWGVTHRMDGAMWFVPRQSGGNGACPAGSSALTLCVNMRPCLLAHIECRHRPDHAKQVGTRIAEDNMSKMLCAPRVKCVIDHSVCGIQIM